MEIEMTEEDEAFNAIERQAKQRMEAVRVAMLKEEDDDIQDYKKPWIGLTDEDAIELLPVGDWEIESTLEFAKAIEAKLKEKNT
jgi:hypothetical protein